MIESSRASGRALLRGIADYSHQWGPWSFSWETSGLEKAWPTLQDGAAKGVILRDVDKLQDVLSCDLPTVVIGHQHMEIAGAVNVITDSEAIGRLAADHLMACGFRHFAFCGYTESQEGHAPWSEARRRSFQGRLGEEGFGHVASFHLPMHTKVWSHYQREALDWLRSLAKPVGLFACNDDCGQRIMEICRFAGLAVPDEIGVIGTDNDEVICGLTDPPMSSIAMNFQRAGYEAARALDRLIQGKSALSSRIITEASGIAARRSTDFVAAEDPHLRKALRFIRDGARHTVSVADVAAASGLSRRSLEKAFRNQIGRTILEEIRRVRTDQIAHFLVETELTVAQIADALDFPDVQHVARYFRAVKRVSPTAFRRLHGNVRGR